MNERTVYCETYSTPLIAVKLLKHTLFCYNHLVIIQFAPDIYTKPIIDVLPVVNDISLVNSLNTKFEALGYVCMGEYGIAGRRFYWKSKGNRTHHIHIDREVYTESKGKFTESVLRAHGYSRPILR